MHLIRVRRGFFAERFFCDRRWHCRRQPPHERQLVDFRPNLTTTLQANRKPAEGAADSRTSDLMVRSRRRRAENRLPRGREHVRSSIRSTANFLMWTVLHIICADDHTVDCNQRPSFDFAKPFYASICPASPKINTFVFMYDGRRQRCPPNPWGKGILLECSLNAWAHWVPHHGQSTNFHQSLEIFTLQRKSLISGVSSVSMPLRGVSLFFHASERQSRFRLTIDSCCIS